MKGCASSGECAPRVSIWYDKKTGNCRPIDCSSNAVRDDSARNVGTRKDVYGRIAMPLRLSSGNLIETQVNIDGCVIPGFLDTGGSRVFLDSRAYVALCEHSSRIKALKLQKPKNTTISCANETVSHIIGRFNTKFRVGAAELEGNVCVVKNQSVPILVGGEALKGNGVGIDYLLDEIFVFEKADEAKAALLKQSNEKSTRSSTQKQKFDRSQTANVNGKRVQFGATEVKVFDVVPEPESIKTSQLSSRRTSKVGTPVPCAALVCPRDDRVPAGTQHLLWCHLPDELVEGSYLIEPDDEYFAKHGLYVPAVVVDAKQRDAPLCVHNLVATDVKICRDKPIARITPVTETKTSSQPAAVSLRPAQKLSRSEKLEKILAEMKFESVLLDYPAEKQQLRQIIEKHLDVFAENDSDIGEVSNVRHVIDTGNATPVKARARFQSPTQRAAIQTEVDMLKKEGWVRPSCSPWAAPALIVKKQDGSNRLVIDYRQLNLVTVPDRQPLPHMKTLFDRLHGAQWFMAFDVLWGYFNVKVDEKSIEKTAFIANDELLEFVRMPFGLSNAPATFQRMIQTALAGLSDISAAFLDDILVFGNDLQQLLKRTDAVLERLKACGVRCKPRKCVLATPSLAYLGYQVSSAGLTPIPAKLQLVQAWPQPTSIKELRGFLGLVNRYFPFYAELAIITAPLARETGRRYFIWTDEMQEAFDKTKRLFQKVPTLAIANPGDRFILETDASSIGIGAVLLQTVDGLERPVAYFSRALKGAQTSYDPHKLELYALYQAVRHFAPYLSFTSFSVRTDNSALSYWRTAIFADGDVRTKWKSYLDGFRFDIAHQRGSANSLADAISRAPHLVTSTQLKPIHARDAATSTISSAFAKQLESNAVQDWSADFSPKYKKDHAIFIGVLSGKHSVKDTTVHAGSVELKELFSNRDLLELHNDIIVHKSERHPVYVPAHQRAELLEGAHSLAHQSAEKLLAALRLRLWWPSMRRDVKRHVGTCDSCIRSAPKSHEAHAKLQLFYASNRFELVHLDLVGGNTFPETQRKKRYILVMIDHFTRYCVAVPVANKKKSTIAKAFVMHWVLRFGAPMRVHSDQGGEFVNDVMEEVCALLHIQRSTTLAYNPQGNGACERMNRTLLDMLRKLVSTVSKALWDEYVPYAVFAYNTTFHRATGHSPYELVHGEEVRLPYEMLLGSPSDAQATQVFARNLVTRMQVSSEHARLATKRAQSLAKDYYDANIRSRLYSSGDIVFVQVGQLEPGAPQKLAARWTGPYQVKAIHGVRIELVDLNEPSRTITVHHNRLSAKRPYAAVLKEGRGQVVSVGKNSGKTPRGVQVNQAPPTAAMDQDDDDDEQEDPPIEVTFDYAPTDNDAADEIQTTDDDSETDKKQEEQFDEEAETDEEPDDSEERDQTIPSVDTPGSPSLPSTDVRFTTPPNLSPVRAQTPRAPSRAQVPELAERMRVFERSASRELNRTLDKTSIAEKQQPVRTPRAVPSRTRSGRESKPAQRYSPGDYG